MDFAPAEEEEREKRTVVELLAAIGCSKREASSLIDHKLSALKDKNTKRPWVKLGNAANFKSLSRARDFKVEVVVEEEEEDDDDDEVEEEGELGLGSDIDRLLHLFYPFSTRVIVLKMPSRNPVAAPAPIRPTQNTMLQTARPKL